MWRRQKGVSNLMCLVQGTYTETWEQALEAAMINQSWQRSRQVKDELMSLKLQEIKVKKSSLPAQIQGENITEIGPVVQS